MPIKSVVDTHRLMYRNARLRALDLSDHTTPIEFVNVTDDNTEPTPIGHIVTTNEHGYVCYGDSQQLVTCLAVTKSAIVQVDIHGNDDWNIEWVIHVDSDRDYVTVEDIGCVYNHDGEQVWNPLDGDWHLPDWVERDEIGNGEWAEGQMDVAVDSPEVLNITKWTHTIIFRNGHAAVHKLSDLIGRYGQTIALVNVSNTSVAINNVAIPSGSTALAVYDYQSLFGAWHITSLNSGTMRYRTLSISGSGAVTLDDPSVFYIIRTRSAETLEIIANASPINGIIIAETGDCPVRLNNESMAMDKYVCVGDSTPFTIVSRNGVRTLYVPDSGRYAEACTCRFVLSSSSNDTHNFITDPSSFSSIAKSFGVYQFTLNMEAQSNDTRYLNVVIPYNMNNRIATMHIKVVASDSELFHDCQYTVRLVTQNGMILHEFNAATVDSVREETLFRGSVII